MSDPVSDLKQELLAAAERQQHAAASTYGGKSRRHPGRNLPLLAAATLSIAAAALLVTAPWKSSPGFLERAQAALTPAPGTILHYRWEATRTSKDFRCTVTEGPNEIWIDQTPPYRYRVLTSFVNPQEGPLPGRTLACGDHGIRELGGSQTEQTLIFVPPDTLKVAHGVYLTVSRDPLADFREMIREALATGRAHHEGKTELDGRVVERIRIDPESECHPPLPCPSRPSYAYLDPETYLPVQVESPSGLIIRPGRDGRLFRLGTVARYLKVEYLPRTAANLALTDIRAQHPDATGP